MAVNTGIAGNNFLTSFNTTVPKLFITAETDNASEFDQITLKHWREEGFDVTYIPMGRGGKAYQEQLKNIPNSLPLGEYFGIVGTCYSPTCTNAYIDHTKQQHTATLQQSA